MWLAGVVVFALPRGLLAYWESLGPRWPLVVFAPILIAACSLLIPLQNRSIVLEDVERERRTQFRSGIFSVIFLVLIVCGALLVVNSMTGPAKDPGFVHRCNVAGSVALAILVGSGAYLVWRFRTRGD